MDPTAVCKFFQTPRGCLRGESCTFRHEKIEHRRAYNGAHASASVNASQPSDGVDVASGITSYSPGNPYASGMNANVASPCRFFLTEAGCRNGGACSYAHMASAPTFAPPQVAYASDPNAGMMYMAPQMLPPPPMMPLHAIDTSSGMPMMRMQTTPTVEHDANTAKPRRKLNIQANPSKKANYETISEIMPVLTRDIEGPFFAIDVECVATGAGVDDRDVARIAVVNEDEDVAFDQHVMPDKPIVSYLTQLTGISESNLVGAPSLAEAMVKLRAILPRDSVIVGQSIKKDLEWLGLVQGEDYKQAFDVANLFRIPMQSKNGTIRYRFFSLRHVAKYLLGHDIQEADHDPVIDAKYAMKIFTQFRHLHESPGRRDAVYQTLLQTPRTPSFAERYPVIDGVLMRAPRKPRENHHHHQSHHHQQNPYRDQNLQYGDVYDPNAMQPPVYAPDPTLMT